MTYPTPQKLNFGRDVQGYNAYAPNVSNNMFVVQLTSGANSTLTLPLSANSWLVTYSYSPGSEIWVAYNGSALAPSSGTFATSSSELLPGQRIVSALNITSSSSTTATTINFLNNGASTANIWVGLYANS